MPSNIEPHHILDAGIDLGKTIVQLSKEVASVIPIPGLGPAAIAVNTIITVSQNVSRNRHEAEGLANRCVVLLGVLKDKSEGLDSNQVLVYASQSCEVLERIAIEIEKWSTYSTFDKVLLRKDISNAITNFHKEIDSRLLALGVIANVETGRWQQANDKKREQDQQELLDRLDVITKGQLETKEQVELLRQENSGPSKEQWVHLMELLQQRLDVTDEKVERRDLEKRLLNVKIASGELPPRVKLQGRQVQFINPHPIKSGDRYDIIKGIWMEGEEVAIKLLRGVEVKSQHFRRFWRESELWRDVWEVDHGKYFLPYYGTIYDQGPYPYMISPWQKNGNATEWVKHKTLPERLELVKYVAHGVQILHKWQPHSIVHGDIRGENMLIDEKGNPRLTDFGLAKILEYATGTSFTQSSGISQSFRWFAPELSQNNAKLTTASDIFSFGMSIIELMTGKVPFAEVRSTPAVLLAITQGKRPNQPPEIPDDLWKLVKDCLCQDAEKRPSIDAVVQVLDKAVV